MHETVVFASYNALDESDAAQQTGRTMSSVPTTAVATIATTVIAGDLPTTGRVRGPVAAFRQWRPASRTATAWVVGVSIASAFAAYFARRLTADGLSSATVAFARFALIAVVLIPFVRLDREHRTASVWGFGSGAAMGVGWIAYVHAVESGAVAASGVVYMTYPLFTVAALAAVFRMRPTLRQVAGGLLVVLGAVVALGGGAGGGLPLVAFLAPATFGFSIAVLTERLSGLDPFERLGSVAAGASISLVPVLLALPADEVLPASAVSWLWIVGLGIGCALLPMLLYAACAPTLGAARSAVAGAAELPTVFVIGAVFFGEVIRIEHLLAAGIIVVAIAITPTTRTPHVEPDADAIVRERWNKSD